jgi:hypothetical protein
MPVLRLLSSDGRQVLREFRIVHAETTIGRGRDNDIVLADDSVSRRHARLRITAGACTIVDENSVNGVWVRDARIRSARLSPDELFRVGDCLLQLAGDDAPLAAARPSASAASPPWGMWAACLILLLAAGGCAGGLLLYVTRDSWMPLLPGPRSTASGTATPALPPPRETPCPPPDARLCAWTYGTPATTAAECPPGFCWDGGPLGTATCKQEALVEHSHRSQWSDVFCDEGFTPVLSRCSNAIERCVARP